MDQFSLSGLLDARDGDADGYVELLRRDALSVGLYRLSAGSEDPQNAHTEDEIYHVLRGRAKLRVGNEVCTVEPGDVVFVERNVSHEFFDISVDLALLVVFVPAEGTLSS